MTEKLRVAEVNLTRTLTLDTFTIPSSFLPPLGVTYRPKHSFTALNVGENPFFTFYNTVTLSCR